MLELTRRHTTTFQQSLRDAGIELALLSDADSIAYLAGFWGYLGIEFGRPTLLLVPQQGAPTVITPLMESEMVANMTWVEDVRPWQDSGSASWQNVLATALDEAGVTPAVESATLPAVLNAFLQERYGGLPLSDVAAVLSAQRMIKSGDEIAIMRQAGQIGIAMVEAGRAALGEGVPEYEVALAIVAGGTRKAAEFLTDQGWDAFVSPTAHNLQVLQSGTDTCMVHRRSTVRTLRRGDPVYMCFCNMISFKQYKLGFDREFFIGEANDERVRVYETAVAAQRAALSAVRPGVAAEEPALAANEVYRSAGFSPGYRTGRAIGVSFLEAPELKQGDRTLLQAGMTFAVDGGITVDGEFGARVGDSIVVAEGGYECLTPYPKDLCIV
ncbi:MAG: Xaa-Pro peptidase family protein [Gammaproteobacteria bacterium]|nr:Xaa-Pro peptidase family protein [Gammaproteobacteria bacterium]